MSMLENLLVYYARHFPVQRGKLRVVNALWRTAIGDGTPQRLAELTHGGFRMSCDLTEMLQRQYYFFGTYFLEQRNLDCWARVARGARVVFDVGANNGIFSLCALSVEKDATVHAFEPTPVLALHLRDTAALNGLERLHVHEAAVHQQSGWAVLHRFRGDGGSNEGMNYVTRAGDAAAERVRTVSLDEFCREHAIAHIDLLKLDIQGNEHEALAGAALLLSEGRIGTLFVELNWEAASPGAAAPASLTVELLDRAGYRFAAPGERLDWQKAGEWLTSLSDVVARRE